MSGFQSRWVWPLLWILGCLALPHIVLPIVWQGLAPREPTTDITRPTTTRPHAEDGRSVAAAMDSVLTTGYAPAGRIDCVALVPADWQSIGSQASASSAQSTQPEQPAQITLRLQAPVEGSSAGELETDVPKHKAEGLAAPAGESEASESLCLRLPEVSLESPDEYRIEPDGERPTSYPPTTVPVLAKKLSRTAPEEFQQPFNRDSVAKDLQEPAGRAEVRDEPAMVVETVAPVFPEPVALLEQLGALAEVDATALWAKRVQRLVADFRTTILDQSGEADGVLDQMEESLGHIEPVARGMDDADAARRLRRTGYGLRRRLALWRALAESDRRIAFARPERPKLQDWGMALASVQEMTADSPEGEAWCEYLMLESLRQSLLRRGPRLPRALARRISYRLTEVPMTEQQQAFLSDETFDRLAEYLRSSSDDSIALVEMLEDVERYEQTRSGSDARRVADDCLALARFEEPSLRQLGSRLETDYRNANMRINVTAELLERLMPPRTPEYAPVRDTLLGFPIRGRSVTSNEVHVRLLPDPERIRIALEVEGQVNSVTSSTSGPATFYNNSVAHYKAQKAMAIDLQGIRLEPARVWVNNRMQLRDVETEFDGLPLFGALAQGVARNQHEQRRGELDRAAERKVAVRASQRLNTEATSRLSKLAERLRKRVFTPLHKLSLDPTAIESRTLEDRFVMRIRLAGDDQLGAHTPRPRAPSDSLASVQIHETALNNLFHRLELDGREFRLPELSRHVAEKLGRPEVWKTDPEHDDVVIVFAPRDAASVQLEDGQVTVTLAIDKLSKGRRHWRDFRVRAFYEPTVEGSTVRLAREEVIHLIGDRLGLRGQIALRGIFSKTFSKDDPLVFSPTPLKENPDTADIAVTQLVIDDGWLGAALGPRQTAQRRERPDRELSRR